MARQDLAHPLDVDGEWFVDTRCIACDVARHWAPELIGTDAEGLSFIRRQPETPEERAAMWRAAEACPTRSIASRRTPRPSAPAFPHELTPGVLAMGNNSRDSFGAHSYLVVRPHGNLLVDSPRYSPSLAAATAELGGVAHVLLTHRDDVADAATWAERFGARVWIHAGDAGAAPGASDVVDGLKPVTVAPGVELIPVPGHTRGSVVYHVAGRWLFTGDSLAWSRSRGELEVFGDHTWYSWDELGRSMDRIADLAVEWVFPGHGMWHRVGEAGYRARMHELGPAMRRIGQADWDGRAPAAEAG